VAVGPFSARCVFSILPLGERRLHAGRTPEYPTWRVCVLDRLGGSRIRIRLYGRRCREPRNCSIGGFTNYVFPKGPGGFGNQTKAEFLSDNRLTLDVGLLLEKPHTYDAFVGYRYWLNKYGNNDDVATNGNLQGM
jgi:hypothetical protein